MTERRPRYMDRLIETLCCPFCSGERATTLADRPLRATRGERICANCGKPWPPQQVIRSNGYYVRTIGPHIAREEWPDAVQYVKDSLLFRACQEQVIPCGFWITEVRDTHPYWRDPQIEVLLYIHGGEALRPLPVGGDPRLTQLKEPDKTALSG